MRKLNFTAALLCAFTVLASFAYSQRTAAPDDQTTPSKRAGITASGQADYNLGLMVKRIATLEAKVSSLQKQNDALASQIASVNSSYKGHVHIMPSLALRRFAK